MQVVFGVEMLSFDEIGKELNKKKSDVSKFLARAGINSIAINKKRYFSKEAIVNYLNSVNK